MPWGKGEGNSQAKLTPAQVRAIRKDTRACKVVGNEYGLSQAQVSRIRRRVQWKDLPDEDE